MLVPAGSTWGGPGGDEWAEALQGKAPLGSQQAVRAATHSEHRAGPENVAVEADPPQQRGRPLSQEKRREEHPAVPPGYWWQHERDRFNVQQGKSAGVPLERQRQTREGQWRPWQMTDGPILCARQRTSREGSSPSGSRVERAISKGGGNASPAPMKIGEDRVSTARWNPKGMRRSTGP
jgi:hypothetical protein